MPPKTDYFCYNSKCDQHVQMSDDVCRSRKMKVIERRDLQGEHYRVITRYKLEYPNSNQCSFFCEVCANAKVGVHRYVYDRF